jgi:hypothetical protein
MPKSIVMTLQPIETEIPTMPPGLRVGCFGADVKVCVAEIVLDVLVLVIVGVDFEVGAAVDSTPPVRTWIG